MEEVIELKQPKTFEEQLQILEDRNMIIDDKAEAIKVLRVTNYYRLTAYALQFKNGNDYNHNISFNTMYRLYKFDKRLRHLLLEILESIEVALRTYMSYNLSIKYGPEAHKNIDIFKDADIYSGCDDFRGNHRRGLIEEINLEVSKNRKELFVYHHLRKYNGHFPIWVIVEIFSFGMLSKTYKNLNTAEQKEISRNCFGANYMLVESWLDNLSYIRNICAHYGRLYNKKMTITPKIHNKHKGYDLDLDRLFVSILAIKELTKNSSEWDIFNIQLGALINENIEVLDLSLIGFPENWDEILMKN